MTLSRSFAVTGVAVTMLTVAGCSSGSDSASSSSTTPSSTSSSSSMSSMSSMSSTTSSTSTTSMATSTSTSMAPTSAGAGPAPEGAAIKAGTATHLPATVAGWSKNSASSGPASIYTKSGALASVSFLAGGKYEGDVGNIVHEKIKAGTGYCGTTTEASNLTCYLKTADGVLNVSADAGDTKLAELVAFSNDLTKMLGTS